MKNYKKIIALNSAIVLLSGTAVLSFNTMSASAICCRKDSFDKSRYSLTGNMAEDVATIAKSQKGRHCSDFGYSGEDYGKWCDEYVADCIENAGGDSNIVDHGGTVSGFEGEMRKRGAVTVNSPKVGDLVFFQKSHVEIVTRIENGVVYCAGGNNQGKKYPGGICAGERKVSDVGPYRLYLRPNYTKGKQIIENKSVYNNPFNYTIPTRLLKYKSPMMNGDDVRWLQSALTYLGYGCTVDGYFGNDTKSKVMAYQKSKGLSVDGIVGNATLSSLKNNVDGTNAAKSDGKTTNTSNYSTPSKTLRYTSPLQIGEDVKWLQASLNKLIGAGLNVDGMFGKKTYNAVKTFQQINGLAVDGIVGTNTRGKINDLLNDSNYVAPEASVSSITKIGYSVPTSTLRYGSKGDKVRWLQVALNCTIFSGLSVDGHYGAQTQNAVKKYQSQNGLSADGICGPQTLSKLKSTLSSMNIVAGGSAVPSVVSIEFANKEKHIYANEESIPFEFDSDSGETYQLTILDNAGNEIHKYVTDEYKLSVNLEPGEYFAYVTAVNDKGSLSSNKVNFTVINQSKLEENVSKIKSYSYDTALSYSLADDRIYVSDNINYESMWEFNTYEDWTFRLVNSYYGKELAVADGKLVAEDITVDNDSALWYLYEEDEMKFIKNKDSDMALTITSDGEVCAAALDISSYAQALTIENQNATNLLPKYTKIDDKISRLDWNPIDGANDYTLYIYGNNDEVYDIKEINTNSCEFETPSDWKYHIYIEANVGPSIIVGADFDDNTVILPESEENATQEPETKDDNEFYISMIIELNKYLLNDVGYDSMNIKDLDMNLDGKINVVDLAILKSLVK
ncbi:MAG: peptidoglycan-binding protein [Oscillospiraceae bacterium]|nr:peptidoglycan-binding protein [Oscillospiraceae bacterium]